MTHRRNYPPLLDFVRDNLPREATPDTALLEHPDPLVRQLAGALATAYRAMHRDAKDCGEGFSPNALPAILEIAPLLGVRVTRTHDKYGEPTYHFHPDSEAVHEALHGAEDGR